MTNTYDILNTPLSLPCGAVIKNRFMKSAMSEILGTPAYGPSKELATLYGTWAQGGTGLLITGNVMIDPTALGEPKNVVIEDERHLGALSRWATAGTKNGAHIWVQLNHPGKQSPRNLSRQPVAPSAIGFESALKNFFATPKALEENEIQELIQKFARSAGIVKKAGFTGVQIHAAHGYLVSQFLSPLHNRRADAWGGSIENRMRFVMEIYRAIRQEVGPDFPVGIKLNSADFLRGGFTEEDAAEVVAALAHEGIDLVEMSGGTYEAPAMTGSRRSQSGEEAYFMGFARKIRKNVQVPLVVTGGFRTSEAMASALAGGEIDMVGLARPLVVDPDLPSKILSGQEYRSSVKPLTTGIKLIDRLAMLEITWYENQIGRIGRGNKTRPNENVWVSLIKMATRGGMEQFRRRRA
ncbi:MAG: NADH:flavin oxidoreductase/NADH oxidase family protein [Proteobacteria bacterium]|nr:NADH:flavin oxidoreductase/NADH oxidase family protein [Pseudomonadota bacterium]